ncbi:MAG: glycosyltransferase family 39 protein [Elusimicrobia bacterium]|nr:glycosyltransferase family 39 protein [Candidatus Liberimonas magnetica]
MKAIKILIASLLKENKKIELIYVLIFIGVFIGYAVTGNHDNSMYYVIYYLIIFSLIYSSVFRHDFFSNLLNYKIIAILTIAFLLRCYLSLFSFAHINYRGTFYYYDIFEATVAHGDVLYGFPYNIFWSPFKILESFGAMTFEKLFIGNMLLNIISLYLLYLILKRILENSTIVYIGLIIFAFSPIQIRYAATESHCNLIIFLHLLLIYSSILCREDKEKILLPTYFLVLSFLTFVRPEQFPVVIPFTLYILINSKAVSKIKITLYIICYLLIVFWPFILPFKETLQEYRGLVNIAPENNLLNKLINIMMPFANSNYSSGHFVLPLYYLFLAGVITGIINRPTRNVSVGLFIIYVFFVATVPVVYPGYFINYYYSSYLEYIPIIFICILMQAVEKRLLKRYMFAIFSVLIAGISLLQLFLNYNKIIKAYDEQIEYKFIKNNIKEYGRVNLLKWPIDSKLESMNELFINIETFSVIEAFKKIYPLLRDPVYPWEDSDCDIYFRPLCYGFPDYDKYIEKYGFIPLNVKTFDFEERFPSYPVGVTMKIGFYKRAKNIGMENDKIYEIVSMCQRGDKKILMHSEIPHDTRRRNVSYLKDQVVDSKTLEKYEALVLLRSKGVQIIPFLIDRIITENGEMWFEYYTSEKYIIWLKLNAFPDFKKPLYYARIIDNIN